MKKCQNCGKCCLGSPCGMAEKYGYGPTPSSGKCPAVVRIGNKYFCSLVLNAKENEKRKLMHDLKIGEGCHLWN